MCLWYVICSIKINTYICTCRHIYIHIHTKTYIHKHKIYTHTYIYTYIHACMHACIHTCIHTYIHTYILICIHTYIHSCLYAYHPYAKCTKALQHTFTVQSSATFMAYKLSNAFPSRIKRSVCCETGTFHPDKFYLLGRNLLERKSPHTRCW